MVWNCTTIANFVERPPPTRIRRKYKTLTGKSFKSKRWLPSDITCKCIFTKRSQKTFARTLPHTICVVHSLIQKMTITKFTYGHKWFVVLFGTFKNCLRIRLLQLSFPLSGHGMVLPLHYLRIAKISPGLIISSRLSLTKTDLHYDTTTRECNAGVNLCENIVKTIKRISKETS